MDNIDLQPTTAEFPFELTEMTDVILQTPDGVQFHTNRIILSISSQVFKDMFTLPSSPADAEEKTPVIHVHDNSRDLFQVLPWCHPHGSPSTDFDDLVVTLRLASKYIMEHVIKRVERMLLSSEVIKKECFRVYAIAVQYQFGGVAKMAAQYTLEVSTDDIPDAKEFKLLSGDDLHKLNKYRSDCILSMRKVVGNHEWSKTENGDPWPEIDEIVHRGCRCWSVETKKRVNVKLWLVRYMDEIESRLRDKPTSDRFVDGTSFEFIKGKNMCDQCRNVWNEWATLEEFIRSITRKLNEAKDRVQFEL